MNSNYFQKTSAFAFAAILLLAFNNCSSFKSTSNSTSSGDSLFSTTDPTQGGVAQDPVNSQMLTAQFASSDMTLPNPDRGWAFWSGTDIVSAFDSGSANAAYAQGYRLLSCLVSLANYRSTSIPQSYLDNLNMAFGKVRQAGMKCALLIRYDDSAAGIDAPAAQIVSHMGQLKPVLQANADVIAVAKAGMIGAWGEWHSSQNGNSCCYNTPPGVTEDQANANRAIIRDAILAAFHPQTFVEFRYPADLMRWYPSVLALDAAFGSSFQARAAAENDCFQGGPDDTGTYGPGSTGTDQRHYVSSLSEFAPYGGEQARNCASPHRISCSDILTEGALYHLSWLKDISGDTTEWTDAWKSGGCYNQVLNQMGYRIRYQSISLPDTAARGRSFNVQLALLNSGWARVFGGRHVQIVLTPIMNGANTIVQDSVQTLQNLPSQSQTAVSWTIPVSIPASAEMGDYDVGLRVPDVWMNTANRRDFMIRPANANQGAQSWDDAKGIFHTGLKIRVE